jgi:hypothetical protein
VRDNRETDAPWCSNVYKIDREDSELKDLRACVTLVVTIDNKVTDRLQWCLAFIAELCGDLR